VSGGRYAGDAAGRAWGVNAGGGAPTSTQLTDLADTALRREAVNSLLSLVDKPSLPDTLLQVGAMPAGCAADRIHAPPPLPPPTPCSGHVLDAGRVRVPVADYVAG